MESMPTQYKSVIHCYTYRRYKQIDGHRSFFLCTSSSSFPLRWKWTRKRTGAFLEKLRAEKIEMSIFGEFALFTKKKKEKNSPECG